MPLREKIRMVNKKSFTVLGIGLLLFGVLVQYGPGQTTEVPGMSLIPAGEFWMGRTHMFMFDELNWVARARLDDQPSRPVYVDAFYMDKYEVTDNDYAEFVKATNRPAPWHWKGGKVNPGQEKWPVYNVSWDDAAAYCSWTGKRLPTEAEWERAARGGLDRNLYPWGNVIEPEDPNAAPDPTPDPTAAAAAAPAGGAYGATSAKKTIKMARYGYPNGPTDVGTFPPNGYGLYDVTGNVWEWVQDWYDQGYYATGPRKNPRGPEAGKYRVIRGGGWGQGEEGGGQRSLLGVHYRNYGPPDQSSNVLGFRCAKDAPQQ
jgi:iron(II)-dependent oxidoreductase